MFVYELLVRLEGLNFPAPAITPGINSDIFLEWKFKFSEIELCVHAPFVSTLSWIFEDPHDGELEGEERLQQDYGHLVSRLREASFMDTEGASQSAA
jgi:hypothetical protein